MSEPPLFVPLPGEPGNERSVAVAPAPPEVSEPPVPPAPPDLPPDDEMTTPPPEDSSTEEWDDRPMTLVEHLEELRKVLIVSLLALAGGTIVGLVLSGFVLDLLVRPLDYLHKGLSYFSPMGWFTIHMKVGLVVGFALSLPIVLMQVWGFIKPGLRPQERKFAGPLLVTTLVLFVAGAALAYFFLYIAVRVIGAISHDPSLTFLPEANAWIGFVVILMLAFGISFEFPIALILLAFVGIVSSERLRKWRRPAYFIIAAVGYLITPGVDPVTPLALIVPLLLLFESAVFVIRRFGR